VIWFREVEQTKWLLRIKQNDLHQKK